MKPQVPWIQLATFLLITFGLTWALIGGAKLVASDALTWPPMVALMVSMWVPGLVAIGCSLGFEGRAGFARRMGLGVRGWKRWLLVSVAGSVMALSTSFAAVAIAHYLGLYTADLVGLGGLRETLAAQLGETAAAEIDLSGAMWSVAILLPVFPLINVPVTLGEELGWRSYLLPKLLPLGTWPALVVHSLIWGVWHAPAILILGHNYGVDGGLAGVAMMTAMCLFLGLLHGWTRLATGSVWPAAFMHSALNASAGLILMTGAADQTLDPFSAGVTGWSGMIVPALFVVALVAFRQFRPVFDEPTSSTS